MDKKMPLALCFQVEDHHGSKRMVGHVCYVAKNGDLRNPIDGYGNPYSELADLEIGAWYETNGTAALLTARPAFKPYQVDLERAESMIKVLRKIERHTRKMEDEEGYPHDFHGHAVRFARALGIKQFYVRNSARGRESSGELYRPVNAAGLQCWITDRTEDKGKNQAA